MNTLSSSIKMCIFKKISFFTAFFTDELQISNILCTYSFQRISNSHFKNIIRTLSCFWYHVNLIYINGLERLGEYPGGI